MKGGFALNVKPIKNEADHEAVLREIERLFEAAPGTPDGDRLEILATLVEAYEKQVYPIPLPDPIEAIFYYMESRGLTRRDLEPHIGHRARVSEILTRKRPLTLRMMQRLHEALGIPAEVLLQPYALRKARQRPGKTPAKQARQATLAGRPR